MFVKDVDKIGVFFDSGCINSACKLSGLSSGDFFA